MRVAAIYDVHANLPALEAAMSEIRRAKVDQIVVGGDVLPGPFPRETLDYLLELNIPTQFIHGNGDREALAQMSGIETDWYRTAPEQWREPVRWSAQQLNSHHRQLLAEWPATCEIKIPGLGDVLFCHATPGSDTEVFTRLTPEDRLIARFDIAGIRVVICGHTHMQFERMIGKTRVVNAGSVGMPFGRAGAHWLLLGPELQFHCTPYDLVKAAERIRETKYPQAESFAEQYVIRPSSEKEAQRMMARAELK